VLFLARSSRRSLEQAARHPRAACEVVALHAGLAALGGARIRVAVSCLLAITHLGLLGEGNRSLGLANTLSLVRAGLPPRRWPALVAVATDIADGMFARRSRSTAFGAYADPLADLAFWSAVAFQTRAGKLARAAVIGLWLTPTAIIAYSYLAAGRTIDYPRPLLARRASAVTQALLLVHLFRGAAAELGGNRA